MHSPPEKEHYLSSKEYLRIWYRNKFHPCPFAWEILQFADKETFRFLSLWATFQKFEALSKEFVHQETRKSSTTACGVGVSTWSEQVNESALQLSLRAVGQNCVSMHCAGVPVTLSGNCAEMRALALIFRSTVCPWLGNDLDHPNTQW